MTPSPDTSENIRACIISNEKYFRLIYYLSALFGIFPFILESGRYIRSYIFTILSILASILVGGYGIGFNYFMYIINPMGEEYVEKAEKVLNSCFLISQSILYITAASTSIWRVSAVRQIIDIFQEVDGFLDTSLKKNFRLLDVLVFSLNLMLVFWQVYYKQNIIYKSYSCIFIINLWLTMSQFSVLASLIQSRLDKACDSLDKLEMKPERPEDEQKKAAILSDVHDNLCDACEILQNSFGCLLVVLIAVCFVGITVLNFIIYKNQKLTKSFNILLMIIQDDKVLWLIYFLAITWKIADSSSELTKKTKDFNQLLHHLMANSKCSQLVTNDKLLLHLSMKREVVLTACGLFNLDLTLVHSMVAAASTYIVMIIQFDQ